MSKYFNNAIIGNSNILGCLTDKGELIRLYYPNIDYFQNIDTYKMGFVSNQNIFWFNDGYKLDQYYDENILYTKLSVNNVDIIQRDYILCEKNIMVRKLTFNKKINLFIYSKLNSNVNKLVSGMMIKDALIQYCQNMYMATFSNIGVSNYQINNAKDTITNGELNKKDYIGMSDDSAILYKDITEITLYIAFENNQKDLLNTISWAKMQDENALMNVTKKFYIDYNLKLPNKFISENTKENRIISRSILLFKLLSDKNTGGILASPDVDENFTKCGRYGYCWARDALFINKALLTLGMNDIADKFYNVWATKAQLENGLFEQRYYTNGELAPSWGIQFDETSSVLIGLYEKGKYKKNEELIIKAVSGLIDSIDENYLVKSCYDLWEERNGIHLYTIASIYKALKCGRIMLCKINKLKYGKLANKIEKILPRLKDSICKNFIDNGVFKRSLDDNKADISLLSLVIPFDVLDTKDVAVKKTLQELEKRLKLQNGGYLRYEGDNYIGGNAWIISSLWFSMYYIKEGNIGRAKELFDWVTNHADNLDFLPEQIDRNGNDTAWISQLSWSHAMYVLVFKELLERK